MSPYVEENCIRPKIRVWIDGGNLNFTQEMIPGQAPTITTPDTGITVLSFSHSGSDSDKAGAGGFLGERKINTRFNLNVMFTGNKVWIDQRIVVWLSVRNGPYTMDGNVVDKTIIDEYILSVDAQGRLTGKAVMGTLSDSSKNITDWFVGNILAPGTNRVIDSLTEYAKQFTNMSFGEVPVAVVQDFVFPGGRTFAFKSVAFSDNQDLVSHITYADPT